MHSPTNFDVSPTELSTLSEGELTMTAAQRAIPKSALLHPGCVCCLYGLPCPNVPDWDLEVVAVNRDEPEPRDTRSMFDIAVDCLIAGMRGGA